MQVEQKVNEFFSNRVRQIFVYLTNRCQLKCRQCLYKPLLDNHSDDLSFKGLLSLLRLFKDYGAFKISFLGGEPTLYRDEVNNASFSDVVKFSKNIGYTYIRVDTNGIFESSLLDSKDIGNLDEITFSVDGYNARLHDSMRGLGVFDKCVSNIKYAVELGYNVQITSCFHNSLCGSVESGVDSIRKMILLCDELGVKSLNIHPILKVGVERDDWIDNTNVEPHIWLDVYRNIQKILPKLNHKVKVRLPMRYVEKSIANETHDYCPMKMGERALIMPDGTIKACAFNIGNSNCVARFASEGISWETSHNELDRLDDTICCNQSAPIDLTALCMSYKPKQDEVVWNSIHN